MLVSNIKTVNENLCQQYFTSVAYFLFNTSPQRVHSGFVSGQRHFSNFSIGQLLFVFVPFQKIFIFPSSPLYYPFCLLSSGIFSVSACSLLYAILPQFPLHHLLSQNQIISFLFLFTIFLSLPFPILPILVSAFVLTYHETTLIFIGYINGLSVCFL